jgi:hypothetical protein
VAVSGRFCAFSRSDFIRTASIFNYVTGIALSDEKENDSNAAVGECRLREFRFAVAPLGAEFLSRRCSSGLRRVFLTGMCENFLQNVSLFWEVEV